MGVCEFEMPERRFAWSRPTVTNRILELMAFLWAIDRWSQNFGAVFRHHDRVLELSRQFAVTGPYCPSVSFVGHALSDADVNHWFDREADARCKPIAS